MTEDKDKDAVTIEGETTTPEESAVQSETPPREKKAKKSGRLAISIAWLALLSVAALATLAFYFYQENKLLNNQQQANIIELKEQVSEQEKNQNKFSQNALALQSDLKTQVEQVNLELQQVKNASKLYQTDMQALQRALAETRVRHPNDWILAEVEYLVKLAGRKIWMEGDISSAVALLLAADQRVVELSDPSLTVLRSALLEDISTLEALPESDPDGVVLALSALERRVDKLAIIGFTISEAQTKDETKLSTDIKDWQENLAKSWSNFVDSFIVINKRDTQLQALLSPEQSWYLKENLRHALAKAEFAVYREQQDIYDLALQSAANLLKNYYDLTDNETNYFNNSVQRLSKHKISITYPEQLKSLPILDRIIEQRVKKSLASSRVEQE